MQCLTEDGHELTRVSVIDDNYNVLYDQLVKPHKPITDYLTRYHPLKRHTVSVCVCVCVCVCEALTPPLLLGWCDQVERNNRGDDDRRHHSPGGRPQGLPRLGHYQVLLLSLLLPRIVCGFLTPVVRPERRKTIIAGHSVENDLLALRLFHKRVIGTPRRGRPRRPSIRYMRLV